MERPLASVALVYGAGLLGAYWRPVFLPLGWLLPATLAVGYGCLRLEKFRARLLWPFLILCGWTNLTLQTAVISPDDLRVLNDGREELVTVRGVIVEAPRQSLIVRRGQETVRTLVSPQGSVSDRRTGA